MASLKETLFWDKGVYQWESSTAMIGVHAVFEIFYSKNYSSWAELIKVALDTAGAHASD